MTHPNIGLALGSGSARSRLAGEPADVMIRPRLSDFALMDFHRAAQAIAEGVRAAEQVLPALQDIGGGQRA